MSTSQPRQSRRKSLALFGTGIALVVACCLSLPAVW
jgi:hypothetical protein